MTVPSEALSTLSDYFQNAPVGLQIMGDDGRVERANTTNLEMLGFDDHPGDYVGLSLRQFFVDPGVFDEITHRLSSGNELLDFEATMVRRDGRTLSVRLFANGRLENGRLVKMRVVALPAAESRTPDDMEVLQGGTSDPSNLSPDEKRRLYSDLTDFFRNAPVSLHIVGADGRIQHTSNRELHSMGYSDSPDQYLGHHIAEFHADQEVIDEMLDNLVDGRPLVNYTAKLKHRNGQVFPVFIYSSSRMQGDNFVNTRCFTFPLPADSDRPSSSMRRFKWPRNEDYGLNAKAPAGDATPEEAMSVALRYVAGRKRPEETLGFLAECNRILGSASGLDARIQATVELCAGYLADWVGVEAIVPSSDRRLWSGAGEGAKHLSREIESYRSTGDGDSLFERTLASGASHACLDTGADHSPDGGRLSKKGIRSLIVAPITIRGEVAGALSMARTESPGRTSFGPADLKVAEELARRISPEFETARLQGELG